MKCPYCAEDIKDEAVYCRHCSHDFSLVKPLLARLISLEKEVKAIRAKPVFRPVEPSPTYAFSTFVTTALCILLTSGYFFITIEPPAPVDNPNMPKVLAAVLPPSILGLAVGMIWNRRWKSYVPSGIALGLVNFVSMWLMITSFDAVKFRWLLAFWVFAVCQPLIFVIAALVGSAFRRRWNTFSRGRGWTGEGRGVEEPEWKFSLKLVAEIAGLALIITNTASNVVKLLGGGQP